LHLGTEVDYVFPDDSSLGGSDLNILKGFFSGSLPQRKEAGLGTPLLWTSQTFQRKNWQTLSTTSGSDGEDIIFEVIHPFHPLYKQKFKLINFRHNWASYRVYFYNSDKQLVSLPISWTNLLPQDPFVKQAAGKSLFRISDLLRLSSFVQKLNQEMNQTDLDKLHE
jgi:hypothetical protein